MKVLKLFVFMMMESVMGYGFNSSEIDTREDRSQVLSRRKRFLVFDEGSSFQMVFCNTFPTVFAIGDIFLFGYTAALAYELPQDPYSPFRHHGDPLHRRMDTKMIYFTDYDGKVMYKRKYQRKPIVNPAMAKRSVDAATRLTHTFKIDRKLMHASRHKREFLNSELMDARSLEFHRSARASLYPKIETMLQAFGSHGKHCVQRTLCQVGQTQHHPQGSFFQEIIRAIFTLPKGEENYEDLKEYDDAHSANHSCAELFPECDEPTPQDKLPTITY